MTAKKDSRGTSQSSSRILAYFTEITKKEYFLKKVAAARRTCRIPKGGFPSKDAFTGWVAKDREAVRESFIQAVDHLREKYDLVLTELDDLFMHFIFFNEVDESLAIPLIKVRDTLETKRTASKFAVGKKIAELEDEFFPIALMVSPYASERDILDFVEKNFTQNIAPQLEKYKKGIRLGKTQKKHPHVAKRDNFIWANRKLKRKDIQKKVKDEFNEWLDVNYISKIISRRKKMGQKV